jgi:hypothetical protein
MGTLTDAVIATTYKKLVFQKSDNKIYYTNGSDVDTEITTFASALTLSGLITASAGIKLSNSLIYDSSGNEGIKVTATGSAVNYLDVVNSATGNAVKLDVDGTDSNIGLTLDAKGTGIVTCTPDLVVTGDVIITGNDIKSGNAASSTTAMTLSSDDVTVVGDLTVTGTSAGTFTLGADSDGVDRTIVLGHNTLKSVMGIDDSQDVFAINTDAAFETTNDFEIDSSGNVTIGNGELRTTKLAYTDGDDALTISDGGALTTSAGLTVAGNLTFTGARDILFPDASGLEVKDNGGSTYFALISDTITVGQPTTFTGKVLCTGNTGLTAGTGITDASGEVYKSWVERYGTVIKTTILMDITGLRHSAAADIIGNDGTANPCHIGQVTAAINGTIFSGRMVCLEQPTVQDLDLYGATEGTGVENGAIADLTEKQIINGGTQSVGTTTYFDNANLPAANDYLYFVCQSAGDADYSAGKFLIEMWGTV